MLEYIIIRTQILYGTGNKIGKNFVTWVLEKLKKNESIRVVNDQVGNPTFVDDVSESILRLLEAKEFGVFHVSGKKECN